MIIITKKKCIQLMTEWGICFLKMFSALSCFPLLIRSQLDLVRIRRAIPREEQPCWKHCSIVRNQDIWSVCIKHLRNYSLGLWLKLNTIRSIHLPWRSLHFPAIVRDCQLRWKLATSIREQDACIVGTVAWLPASKSLLFFIYNQQFKISCHASPTCAAKPDVKI